MFSPLNELRKENHFFKCGQMCIHLIPEWGDVKQVNAPDSVWFTNNILKKRIEFRTWRQEDKIRLAGFSKRVSDVIKHCKLDLVSRKYVLVMTVDDEVAWIVGLRQSAKFRGAIGYGVPLAVESKWK